MTRGRLPLQAQEDAFPIAGKRGLVQRYQHRPGNTCDFSIMSPGLVSFITVKRLDRLTVMPEDILHDFAAVIALLRFIVSSPAVSRELWLRTHHGAWRFFRVLDNGIIELDRDGKVLENAGKVVTGKPAAGAVKNINAVPSARKKPGRKQRDEAGKNSVLPKHLEENILMAKDLKPAVVIEKYAKTAKNPEPVRNSEAVKGIRPAINSVPDSLPQKNPAPEKYVVPVQHPGTATEPEGIPEIIRKYQKRRNRKLKKDQGSE